MRRLLLVRHGNTFEDGAPVVRVGSRSDLPLTAQGLAQAAAFAAACRGAGLALGPFLAGPLARTRTFVEHGFGTIPRADDRLREIDYGDWEGLTDAEIAVRVGADTLEAWNRRCVWPKGQNWAPSAETLAAGAASLARELAVGDARLVPVLCSSQGVMRYFGAIDGGWFDVARAQGRLGVATGSCCGVRAGGDGSLTVDFWNVRPDPAALADWVRT
jgi:broad specificity phosphatase PhoE